MTALPLKVVVGLGNPGAEHEATRHNAGFWFVDELARRHGGRFKPERRYGGDACRLQVEGRDLWLLKPMTYMNLSGRSVQGAMTFYRVPPERTLVLHDDMDLEFGTLRLKEGGGTAGHRGLESIAAAVGPGFLRVRFGIGRPDLSGAVDHVLSPFTRDERAELDRLLPAAAEMVETAIAKGLAAAMNAFHRRKRPKPPDDEEPE